MSEKPNWITSAIAHGSGLREHANVSFEKGRRILRAIHEVGEHVSICTEDGSLLVRFSYGGDIHYPYWAPVCTPSGASISIFSPHDHIWHRGLWMVWKYVNGVNFWEGPFSGEPVHGAQVVPEIDSIRVGKNSVSVSLRVEWKTSDGRSPLSEKRSFVLTWPSAEAPYYYMDVTSELAANGEEAVISAVDIKQFDWGGYGGIGFRASRDIASFPDRLIISSGGKVSHEVHGMRGDWAAYCGLRDGSLGSTWAGFALIDARNNPVHPVPFHASAEGICYIGTAPARYGSFTIAAGSPRVFRNRFVCFDGETDPALMQKLFEEF
ncbi:MAG TPA: PmoA family protein [Spirochaetia bacterium]|nr:PmoA family protein [Spirochaetia bacterium]